MEKSGIGPVSPQERQALGVGKEAAGKFKSYH